MSNYPIDVKTLRRDLKRKRAGLPIQQQQQAAQALVRHLLREPRIRTAKQIAIYWPVRGEINPLALSCYKQPRQTLYLPVLMPHPDKRLKFVPWHTHTRFRPNRFHIPEPTPLYQNARSGRSLDIVLLPLVAFDQHGTRLGMGGGFYDRTFAFKKRLHHPMRPWLIGLAYAFQRVDQLTAQPWDIPLDAIVTEQGWEWFYFKDGQY